MRDFSATSSHSIDNVSIDQMVAEMNSVKSLVAPA